MVARGKFFLYDAIVPPLPAGEYELTAEFDIDVDDNSAKPVADQDLHFNVTAPRLKLPPDNALMVFPPANSEGSYEARLPQIVLKKKTLPWDRKAAPDGTVFEERDGTGTVSRQVTADHTPWLALVVIAEGEGQIVHDQDWQDCITPGRSLTGSVDAQKASYLSVPKSTVDKVFPTIEDLSLLTNVREVNLDDTEAAMGDDDGFLAVVIANRIPQYDTVNCRPKTYTCCLINLEGQLDLLPPKAPPRLFFEVADIYISETARLLSTSAASGAAVPITASGEPRLLDPSDTAAMTEAVRRGEVVFHEGALVDRAGMTGEGLTRLGTLSAEEFLEGDFSTIAARAEASGARQSFKVDSVFGAFDFPLEAVVTEPLYRFAVLTSWRFICAGAGSFQSLMEGLDVGLLGTKTEGGYERPLPPCTDAPDTDATGPGAAPVAQLPLEIAETGHVGLPHLTRTGETGNAWYRGPFSPHQLLRNPLAEDEPFPVLAHASDHLRMMTPDGREDVSLAVAFETGRLLAMSQPSFVASMLRWRNGEFGAARARANRRVAVVDRMGLIETLLGPRDLERVLDALKFDEIARILEGGLIRELDAARGGAICGPRVIADPGVAASELQGNLTAILSDGLGIDARVLERVLAAPDDPRALGALQTAQPGLVSDRELGLDDSVTGKVDAALDAGLRGLAETALGQREIGAGALENITEFESLDAFVKNRFDGR